MGAAASADSPSSASVTYSTILQRHGADELFGLFVQGSDEAAPIVEKITPNSAAAKALPKLNPGSRILAVNGKRMIGAAAIASAIRAAPFPDPLVLEVEDSNFRLFSKQYRRVAKEANKRAARLAEQGINMFERVLGVDIDRDGDVGVSEPLSSLPGTPRAMQQQQQPQSPPLSPHRQQQHWSGPAPPSPAKLAKAVPTAGLNHSLPRSTLIAR